MILKNKKKKQRKLNKKVLLAILACLLVVATLVIAAILKNSYQRKKIDEAMSVSQKALQESGFVITSRRSGCGRTQVVYGKGAMVCTTSLRISEDYTQFRSSKSNEDTLGIINEKIKLFYKTIENTHLFTRKDEIPAMNLPGRGFNHSFNLQRENKTGASCASGADFDWKKLSLDLYLYCRNTDWFNATFRNGQFEF